MEKNKIRINRHSLFVKMVTIFLLCIIIPMAAVFLYTGYSTSKALKSEINDSLARLAEEKHKQVETVFDLQLQISEGIAKELFLSEFFAEVKETGEIDKEKVNKISVNLNERVVNANGLYENLFLTHNDHVLVDGIEGNSVGMKMDSENEAYYYDQLQTPGVTTGPYMTSPVTGRPVIAVVNSVLDGNGNVLSVLVTALDVSTLTESLAAGSPNQKEQTMILDNSGLVIAASNQDLKLNLNFSESTGTVQDFYQEMQTNLSGTGNFTLEGVEYTASYAKDEKYGMYILSYIPVTAYTNTVVSSLLGMGLINGISIVLVALFVLFYVWKFVKPIQNVSNAARKIADGDLTVDKINLQRKDEIGELAASFNSMLAGLREIIASVSATSNRMSTSSEMLSAGAEQTEIATKQISSTIEQVAAGTEQQLLGIEESTRMVDELAFGVTEVKNGGTNVNESISHALDSASEGSKQIHLVKEQMSTINETFGSLSTSIKSLGVRSNEITQIVQAITDISSQTNMLALNAAIEAARAGEHGKGFAVVADQVRKLAEQSNQSAQQIAKIIKMVQEETNQSVESMMTATKEVDDGMIVVDGAGKTFEQIQKAIHEAASEIEKVQEGVTRISESAEKSVQAVEMIASAAQLNADGTQNASASTEEQLASMGEIASSAVALSDMATELKESIEKFKIS